MAEAPNEPCGKCGGPNFTWAAPSPLWNLVMRGNDINGDTIFGDLVCVGCFLQLATNAGVAGQWRLTVDPLPSTAVLTTPSGRVWDWAKWLWQEPQP